ncbi:Uncharacterised protein [BD1-7 clade bacterium]|uniref:Uncharacterized protein n=1 Tax=BD1-7 clade bacterium TaxID=2029982 RepID=A0A5S9QLE2_9GAMM|nr:Uncharacterised protein [BD1-7 clade bacterium]CAA0121035.1 Uncharacterised protein [BD1-7 clade bacterium]
MIQVRFTILVSVLVLMAGCMEQGLTIKTPENGKQYAGLHNEPPPIDNGLSQLPAQIEIRYSKNQGPRKIYLNGQSVGDQFSYEPTRAWMNLHEVRDFLVQGSNKLHVDPLKFGPSIRFKFDNKGPEVFTTFTCFSGDDSCPVSSNEVKIRMGSDEANEITSLVINGTPASRSADHDNEWEVTTPATPTNNLFAIVAEDNFGYRETTHFLKDGARIDEIFRAKVGESAIRGLTPILDTQISNTDLDESALNAAGLDTERWLDAGNLLVAILWVRIKEIKIGDAVINDFSFKDGNLIALDMDMVRADDGTVGVDVIVETTSSCLVTGCFCWPWQCGDPARRPQQPGGHGMTSPVRSHLYIGTMNIDGDVRVNLNHGAFDVDLLSNLQLNMNDVSGDGFAPIINLFSGLGIFKSIMRGIIGTTIDNNLNTIRLGFNITNDEGQNFDLVTRAETVSTDADNLYMTYSGQMEIRDRDPLVPRTLGSRYEPNALGNYLSIDHPNSNNHDSNLEVNLNSNIINQGFNNLYNIGMTHITVTLADQEVHFGPHAVGHDIGKEGDRKMELVPTGPGTMKFLKGDTNQATLTYQNASLTIYRKSDTTWEEEFIANADISAGVLMEARGNVFDMTINGAPDLKLNQVVNRSPLPISDAFIENVVNLAFEVLYPLLSDTHLSIDIPNVDNPDYPFTAEVTTDDFNSRNGHLRFSMGIEPTPR